MVGAAGKRASAFFWLSTAVLLLWSLGGVAIYVAYFVESPTQFADSAEAPANTETYAEYVTHIPAWAIAVGIGAALARVLGVGCLFLRRAWALRFFVVSLLLFIIVLYRAFILADVMDVMSAGHIATEVIFLLLGIYAVWFARWGASRGALR
jgi:hypothetical protein